MSAYYTDGTPVQEGDRVRYHQAFGGLMAPPRHFINGEWTLWHEGIASKYPPHQERRDEMLAFIAREGYGIDPDELYCKRTTPTGWAGGYGYGQMAGHVIERLP